MLDHGFVRVVDYMGDDGAIVQAARVSYGRGTRRVSEDKGPHQLSDAPPPHDPVRDVRDQVPRQIADLCRPAVDPPPHRQRQRILGALFDPRQRVLYPGARASGGAGVGQPPGPRRCHRGRSGAARPRPLAQRCRARLCRLHDAPQRGRIGRPRRPGLARPRARTGADEPVSQLLYPMVLENRPPQPAAFPVAARRPARPIRNPRLRRGDARRR